VKTSAQTVGNKLTRMSRPYRDPTGVATLLAQNLAGLVMHDDGDRRAITAEVE